MIKVDSMLPRLCCLRTFKIHGPARRDNLFPVSSISFWLYRADSCCIPRTARELTRLPDAVHSTTHNHGPWDDRDYLLASRFGLVVHSVDLVRSFQVGLDMSTSIWHTLPWIHRGCLWSFESFAYLLTAHPQKKLASIRILNMQGWLWFLLRQHIETDTK